MLPYDCLPTMQWIKEKILLLFLNKITTTNIQSRMFRLFLDLDFVEKTCGDEREGISGKRYRSCFRYLFDLGEPAIQSIIDFVNNYPFKHDKNHLLEGDGGNGLLCICRSLDNDDDLTSVSNPTESFFDSILTTAERNVAHLHRSLMKISAIRRKGSIRPSFLTATEEADIRSRLYVQNRISEMNLRSDSLDTLISVAYHLLYLRSFRAFWST